MFVFCFLCCAHRALLLSHSFVYGVAREHQGRQQTTHSSSLAIMSFQDFSSSRRTVNGVTATSTAAGAANRLTSSAPLSGNSAGSGATSGSRSGSSGGALAQISEVLLQYQRNVGILEKIVQSLTVQSRQKQFKPLSFHNEELSLQYKAQVDVVGQLEDKVRRLLSTMQQKADVSVGNSNSINSDSNRTAVIKLQRDFERVQARANALIQGMTKLDKELRQQAANASKNNTTALDYEQQLLQQQQQSQQPLDHYQQVQLQLHHDRLAEEIMREREEEIRNINRGMHQVNEIYKDLAHIVGSQQEQIDQIETQMEESRANAESGLKQVERANEKYGNSQCVVS